MSRLLLSLLLLAPLSAMADNDLIRLAPEQVARGGIATVPLSELKPAAGLRLPAQVIVPSRQVEVIAASVPAMVVAVRVAYGDPVKRGQPLVRLQGGQLLELQRDHLGALAQEQLAAENLRRDESLFADGIIARSRLAATQLAARQATLLAAEKQKSLQLAGIAAQASGTAVSGVAELRAPFDGVVLEASAQPGQRVDAMTPLLKLGRLAPLWLEIQASPSQAAGVAVGDAVSVAGCSRPAKITLVAPHMQLASQSLLIRAELDSPAGCIKPFQFVQASVVSGKALPAGSWRLPTAAMTRHQGQVWVFVETGGGFRPLAVKVLDEAPDAVTVVADLAGTERIAVKGVATLKAAWLGLGAAEGK